MSIATEITRLQTAKADLKTAIEGKGVTVPSATKLDGYADLVETISQGSTPTGTKQISVTQNGTQTENVSGYASAQLNVAVPNSYSASDESKVVSNGALVAQTAHADVTPTTSDQTIDTTTNDSIKVKGDADLVASNIKKDVEIFGVTGSYEGGGGTDYLAELMNNTLTTYSSTETTSTSEYEFYKKTALQSVHLPNLRVIASNCFQDCTGLTGYCRYDSATNLNGASFKNTRVISAEFPKVISLGWSEVFKSDTALELIRLGISSTSLGGNNNIGSEWFNGCTNFKTLIIGYTNRIVTLGNINNFNNTPFASGGTGGTLYVPQSLISQYTQATNWSTILGYENNSIEAIEGSIYETQYADGTPIT